MRWHDLARILVGTAMVMMAVLVIAARAFETPYMKPDPNEKACYAATDSTDNCGKYDNPKDCTAHYMYDIVKFPKGPVAPDPLVEGNTTEEFADCWRRMACVWNWNPEPPNPYCRSPGEFGPNDPYERLPKTVAKKKPMGEE